MLTQRIPERHTHSLSGWITVDVAFVAMNPKGCLTRRTQKQPARRFGYSLGLAELAPIAAVEGAVAIDKLRLVQHKLRLIRREA